MRTLPSLMALLGVLFLAQGCAALPGTGSAQSRDDDGRKIITSKEIARSGSTTAWEVLRRVAGLSLRETSRGEPSSMTLRGQRSLELDETPLVVLDGVAIRDARVLATIRADIIDSIRILDAADATRHHGPMAGGGAIVIQTKTGP